MKHAIIIGSLVALTICQSTAFARFEQVNVTGSVDPFETTPLMQWDDQDIMAQQQPAPIPEPVQPAVPAPVVPATPPAMAPVPVPPPTAATPLAPTPPAAGETPEVTDPAGPATDGAGEEDFSLGDIPIVETVELTTEKAKKALDTYVLVREKYKDAALENYENLQDFVDQSPQGKAFEADVKAAGFPNVIEWNTTITTLSFAYDNSIDDQTLSIKQQIEELNTDTETAQDMRERMIKALQAMIPSDNNRKVLEEIKADPAYIEKLKMLGTETE